MCQIHINPISQKNTSRLNLIQDIFCINANKIHIIPNIYLLDYNSAFIFTEIMLNKTLHLQNIEKRFYICFYKIKNQNECYFQYIFTYKKMNWFSMIFFFNYLHVYQNGNRKDTINTKKHRSSFI